MYLVMVTLEELKKIEFRTGTILHAERVVDTDKLLRLEVDLGEGTPRQIVSGIASYTEPEALIGRQLVFVANLEPRTIRGLESNGMLFALGSGETFSFLIPDRPVPSGTKAG